MKRVGALAITVAFAAPGMVLAVDPNYQKTLNAVCSKGNPWRMPVPSAVGMKEMEAGLKLYGPDTKLLLVCNCTADDKGRNTGITIESDDPSERQRQARERKLAGGVGSNQPRFPHYLPGGSCAVAGSSTIALKPGDKTVETWGTFEPIEAK